MDFAQMGASRQNAKSGASHFEALRVGGQPEDLLKGK